MKNPYDKLIKKVKVIDSTFQPTNRTKALIGKVLEVYSEYEYDNTLAVWNEDKTDWHCFSKSDVQFITPMEFKGEPIFIGDTVNGGLVYDYYWYDGEWKLVAVRDNDWETGCYERHESNIISHIPLCPTKPAVLELTLAEVAEKFGVDVNNVRIKE